MLDELKRLSRGKYVSSYGIAIVHVGLGDTEQAFAWFERAFEERCQFMALIKVNPRLDSMRSDPRFQSLLQRIGLPH